MAKKVARPPRKSCGKVCPFSINWGCGAAGSAPAWHAGGQGFKSPQLHQFHLFFIADCGLTKPDQTVLYLKTPGCAVLLNQWSIWSDASVCRNRPLKRQNTHRENGAMMDEKPGKVNSSLGKAKAAKYDEFYTQYVDIEREVNAYLAFDANAFQNKVVLLPCDDPEWSNFTKYFAQNFDRLGLKKLISTSYAPNAKPKELKLQLSLFEQESPKFDKKRARANGRIFTLERDHNGDKKIDFDDIEWDYLKGDGDFRGEEVIALRDEADIIITNPPFSLFREFLAWIVAANKKFVILGNMNAITYKEVFPLIMKDLMWLGVTRTGVGSMWFEVVASAPEKSGQKIENGKRFQTIGNSCWFTNLDHGRRHQPLTLMTKAENKKFSSHKEVKGIGYLRYDNYNAIEIPYADAIPEDHKGVMGVPISFLGKYSPEQFEIVGMCENQDLYGLKTYKYTTEECKAAYSAKFGKLGTYDLNASGVLTIDGIKEKVYQRILILHRKLKK